MKTVFAKYKTGLLTLTVILACLGFAALMLHLRAGRRGHDASGLVVTTTAKKQDLVLAVTKTGVIAAKNSTPVIPEISGRVQWACANGIVVSKGDEILRLDPTSAEDAVKNLTVRYEEALRRQAQADAVGRARMQETLLRLQSAQDEAAAFERQQEASLERREEAIAFDAEELKYREEEAEIKDRLASKGYIPESEAERETASLKAAEFSVQRSKTDFELKTTETTSDAIERQRNVEWTMRGMSRTRSRSARNVRMSGNEVQNLELQLQRAREDLERTVLKAPIGGLVVLASQGGWRGESRLPRPGDWIAQGREVAQIVSLEQLQVNLELDQVQFTMVEMGQTAEVTLDALPGEVLTGQIVAIGQTARRPPISGWMGMSATATFPVTIDLQPTGEAMIRPGMYATVRIVSKRIENAIVIPTGCIFRHDGRDIVYAKRNGKFAPVAVTTGESTGDYTAILQGLQDGEEISLNDLGDTLLEEPQA